VRSLGTGHFAHPRRETNRHHVIGFKGRPPLMSRNIDAVICEPSMVSIQARFQKGRARAHSPRLSRPRCIVERAKMKSCASEARILPIDLHQAGRAASVARNTHFFPHLLHQYVRWPPTEFPARPCLGDGTDPNPKLAVACPEIERLPFGLS